MCLIYSIAIENGMFVTISVGNRRAQGISPPSDAFFVLSVGAGIKKIFKRLLNVLFVSSG
jgi:hypothetical protein